MVRDSCGVGFICSLKGERSYEILKLGIEAVKNLTHRGAIGGDRKTGDGAGVSIEIPKKLFQDYIQREEKFGVGVFFFYEDLREEVRQILSKYPIKFIAWREVPVNPEEVGESARKVMPKIYHLLFELEGDDIDLFKFRKEVERAFGKKIYIPSLSTKVMVYKGMFLAFALDKFYLDLQNEEVETTFCMFHQRYSTNTFPDWRLAQPFRYIAHNGEINTIQGNRNWMKALESELKTERLSPEDIKPLISYEESDSSSFDRVFEVLILSGYSPEHAINMMVPPTWENWDFEREVKDFFEYKALQMKPWDGPASITFTDGKVIGAHLDRNGLRPARYTITQELIVLGSEVGIVPLKGRVLERGRLGPGETISVEIKTGKVKKNEEILRELSKQNKYGEFLENYLWKLKGKKLIKVNTKKESEEEVLRKQIFFGYTKEEVDNVLTYMAQNGKELTFSMGNDTPLPPLSEKPPLLFKYFKQRFAQVTNPPIDSIRERYVMSLKMNLGRKENFLLEKPEYARRLQIDSPVLLEEELKTIEEEGNLKVVRIPITYPKERNYLMVELQDQAGERRITEILQRALYEGEEIIDLKLAIELLQRRVEEAIREGAEIVILTDRNVSQYRLAIPSLLAIGAVVSHLRRKNLAHKVSFILETGEVRDTHQLACVIGYGASAVYPYLAYQTVEKLCKEGKVKLPYEEALKNYKKSLEDGLLKIMAKMGISTLNSYQGAQIFETVCLNKDFVDEYFSGTPVTLESDGIREVEESLLKRHQMAYEVEKPSLDLGGEMKVRRNGEFHAWSPKVVRTLHKFLKTKDYKDYLEYSKVANEEHPTFIRHLLDYKRAKKPIPLEEVEPEEEILKRFVISGMSLGALSPVAHEVLAEASNRLGMRSCSGEGGEDPKRYFTLKNSAIKQVASGRFGVTPTYLASAKEIEIKIAQGAKPGEGGQLPGHKVNEYIAKLRHAQPGVTLISPPPHHDIYSIEDLKQLIHDLKCANPKAKVCVKLVSEVGVGTVAAGVAKAYADIVQISGTEGGTGASPYSSIKNAGNYWEIGLLETQRVLKENNLREKVRVRVDGGLRTGKDVIIAALMGAEEFGFGTVAMIAEGCVMARQCHLNTCPTGVATQDPERIKKFRGKVEDVMAYFKALAREVREILASMGFRSLEEIIGRTDLLEVKIPKDFEGAKRIKVEELIKSVSPKGVRHCLLERNDEEEGESLNDKIVKDALPYLERGESFEGEYEIRNTDRSVPTKLNYYVALKYRDEGLKEDTVKLTFYGVAGQSFGAFNHRGISLTLIGEANDYLGKGMYGGRIVVRPKEYLKKNVIAGNVLLYGATGGEVFIAGSVGERFAIRNSGCVAVVEGAGLHCCEYMTGGLVVVLGEVAYNFGAGMTGGKAYTLDEKIERKINQSYVFVQRPTEGDIKTFKSLLERHYLFTQSPKAEKILKDLDLYLEKLKVVIPIESCKRDPLGISDECLRERS